MDWAFEGPRLGNPSLFARGPFARVIDWNYAVHPDGRRLLVVLGPPEQSTSHLEVVTGFLDKLRRVAPATR